MKREGKDLDLRATNRNSVRTVTVSSSTAQGTCWELTCMRGILLCFTNSLYLTLLLDFYPVAHQHALAVQADVRRAYRILDIIDRQLLGAGDNLHKALGVGGGVRRPPALEIGAHDDDIEVWGWWCGQEAQLKNTGRRRTMVM